MYTVRALRLVLVSAFFLAVFLIFGGGSVAAQDIRFTAGRVSSTFAEGNEQTVLEDNAVVESDDLRIAAESIRLRGENNRYISAEGAVELIDKENDIELSAEVLRFDTDEEILELEGRTSFKSEADDIQITSTFLERQPDLVIFQLNVQIVREDLFASAEYVRYFEEDKRLELSGFPVVNYLEDEYSASVITVYTDTNEIILEGEVQGTISDTSSEEEENAEEGEDSAENAEESEDSTEDTEQ